MIDEPVYYPVFDMVGSWDDGYPIDEMTMHYADHDASKYYAGKFINYVQGDDTINTQVDQSDYWFENDEKWMERR